MIVCICHRVSDHAIKREAHAGCASFESLQGRLKVGTACGACRTCAREVFEQAGGTPEVVCDTAPSFAIHRAATSVSIGAL
ncbi:MAG: (2Fe-2S)-binding protein [Burkholderiales bacterium]|nr:(2Fe-2S)-binding protein [Burkholderiales bacterium]